MSKVFCKSLNCFLAKMMKVMLFIVFLTIGTVILIVGKDEFHLVFALFLVFGILYSFAEECATIRKWKRQRSYICKVFFNLCAIAVNTIILIGAALFFNKVL